MRGRPERFGETNQVEREIIDDIVFRREMRRQTFRRIAEDLNAQARYPRRADRWMWLLVRNVYMSNRKPPGEMKGIFK